MLEKSMVKYIKSVVSFRNESCLDQAIVMLCDEWLELRKAAKAEPCIWCANLDMLDAYIGEHDGLIDVSGFSYCPACGYKLPESEVTK